MPPSDQQHDISLKRQLRFEYKLTIDSIALSPKMHNTIRKRCLLRIVEIHYYKLLHGRQYALGVSAADAKSDWDRPQPSSGTGVVLNVSSFSSAVYGCETISQGCHCRSSSADYCCSPASFIKREFSPAICGLPASSPPSAMAARARFAGLPFALQLSPIHHSGYSRDAPHARVPYGR